MHGYPELPGAAGPLRYAGVGQHRRSGIRNGDVEQSHFRFKQAVDQALRVRGSRDFAERGAYERFLAEFIRQRNLTRAQRFEAERAGLRALPATPLDFTRELSARVSRFSLIRVLHNHYSVPSRLIGASLKVRVRSESLEPITARCWC
jgi:hypothetical protein